MTFVKRRFLFIILLCAAVFSPLQAANTLSVNASTTVTTFIPSQAFGSNTAWNNFEADYQAVLPSLQSAGIRVLRYPGGSDGDRFHWNGTGSYNAGVWVPDNTNYSPGFIAAPIYNGTSEAGTSLLTDGLTYTAWVSNADTDFPNAQWVYIDISADSNPTVNQVQIWWGTPCATSFQVQYWNGESWPYPWEATSNLWVNTSAGTVAGTGGQQTVNFNAVTTDYIRILMTASSAGAGGAYSIGEVELFNGATQMTVNATTNQSPATVSSMAPDSAYASPINMDFEAFMNLCNSYSPPAIPVIILNFGTGSPQEAAAWVHYANVVKGYNIKYWEVGNELAGNWEIGGPLSATDYGRRFIEYYNAMIAVDPTVKLLGPVDGPTQASNNLNTDTYIYDFSQRLLSASMGNALGGVSVHIYPGDGTDAGTLSTPQTWPANAAAINAGTTGITNASSLPVFMSEYNSDSSGSNLTVRLTNALFLADWLGQYIEALGTRAWANQFTAVGGGNQSGSPMYCATCGNLGMFDNSPGPYQYLPYASYYGMQMMSADWAIANDSRTHTMVYCTSTVTVLDGYADLRPDGNLSLIVINKDPANSYTTTVQISGFTPQGSANTYSYSSVNYQWLTTTAEPYHASPNTPPTAAVLNGVSPSFSYTFPSYSITTFNFVPAIVPSPTFTVVATATTTPTLTTVPTLAPTACASLIAYNGETGTGNVNLSNGWTWYYTPGTSANETAAAAHSGTKGLDLTFNFTNWVGIFDFGWTGIGNYNLTTFDTLELWVRTVSGNMNYMFVELTDAAGAASPMLAVNTYLPGGITTTWQKVSIPLSAFTGINMTEVNEISFYISGLQDCDQDIYIDDMEFTRHCATSPTNTPTKTYTSTFTYTKTFTPTASPTVTNTASNTGTLTSTPTGTITFNPLYTLTNTLTPTPTYTGTPPTVTDTPSITPTQTISETATLTYTFTLTGTSTFTDTPTFTSTFTPTFTVTSTFTYTSTFTRTLTLTATSTITTTATLVISNTQAPAATITPTMAQTGTLAIGPIKPFPNPYDPTTSWPLKIAVNVISGNMDSITLKIYTVSYRLIKEEVFQGSDIQQMSNDLVVIQCDSNGLNNLSEGTYYYMVIGNQGGVKVRSKTDAIIILK